MCVGHGPSPYLGLLPGFGFFNVLRLTNLLFFKILELLFYKLDQYKTINFVNIKEFATGSVDKLPIDHCITAS